MNNNLITTNQNSKIALAKSKSLLNITSKLLANKSTKELIENFKFSLNLGHNFAVDSVSITPDRKYIVSFSKNNIKLWNINSGEIIRAFEIPYIIQTIVAISSDGKYIISGSWDKTIKLWDINTGKEIRTFTGHESPITSLAITPDGKYIVSGSFDSVIKLWNINTGKNVRNFDNHYENSVIFVHLVSVTTDGRYLISSDTSRDIIKIWDIESSEEIRTFQGHNNKIWTVAISSDGKYIASGDGNIYKSPGTIKLWDINTGKEIQNFTGHKSRVNTILITPDGKYIVSGSEDCTIKLWDINSGKEIRSFEGHNDQISSIAINPDGKYIISGSNDCIKLWDISSGKLIASYIYFDSNEWLAWTPNGEYNCSDGAYKYFCFVDDSKDTPEVLDISHPVYKAKKKDKLLWE